MGNRKKRRQLFVRPGWLTTARRHCSPMWAWAPWIKLSWQHFLSDTSHCAFLDSPATCSSWTRSTPMILTCMFFCRTCSDSMQLSAGAPFSFRQPFRSERAWSWQKALPGLGADPVHLKIMIILS